MFLIILSVMAASMNSILLHKTDSYTLKQVYLFNFYCSLVWLSVLLVLNGGLPTVNRDVLFWGILYGGAQVLFLFFKTKAMATGSVTLTTLIGNCSMLLSTAVSVIFWKESLSVGKVIGICLLLVSLYICSYTQTEGFSNRRWKFYCVGFFVFGAMVGIIFKCFAGSESAGLPNNMMITASCVMSVLLLGILGIDRLVAGKGNEQQAHLGTGSWKLVLVCGFLSCFYNRLNMYLSGALPGTIFFPMFNGGTIVASFVLGKVVLQEKISVRQTVGLVVGVCSIIIIGIC